MPSETNCQINGTNYYRLRVDLTNRLGFKPSGKRNIKTFYGKNKKDAEIKKDIFLKDINSGLLLDNPPLGKLMEYWLFEMFKAF